MKMTIGGAVTLGRKLGVVLAAALIVAAGAQAQEQQAKAQAATAFEFARIQDECQQVEGISFGPQGKWQSCRIVRTGFVATIGLQDFFYAQYCLGSGTNGAESRCDNLAQVMFRNRAYKSEAFVEMVRIDPVGTVYERPILVGSENASALVIAARQPGQRALVREYYRRAEESWERMDGRAWLADLQSRLPQGVSIRADAQAVLPDPYTMELRVPLYRSADRNCCASAGVAQVQLNVEEGRFQVADLKLVRAAK